MLEDFSEGLREAPPQLCLRGSAWGSLGQGSGTTVHSGELGSHWQVEHWLLSLWEASVAREDLNYGQPVATQRRRGINGDSQQAVTQAPDLRTQLCKTP